MKYILVGRSGSGKTELAKRLESKGLKVMKTYTTRPCRGAEDAEKYHFIKPDEVQNYKDRILTAEFFGHTYFTTKEDVVKSDVMILEPSGVNVIGMFPDIAFHVVYIVPESLELCDARAIARADDKQAEQAVIEKRRAGEDNIFGPFEEKLENQDFAYLNAFFQIFKNDYKEETIDAIAANMTAKFRKNNNFNKILHQLVALQAVQTNDRNRIIVEFTDGQHEVSLDIFSELAIDNDQLFSQYIRCWLTHQIDFKIPGELAPEFMFAGNVPADS